MKNKYIIVSGILAETPYDSETILKNNLESKVNEKINEGYYPVGSIVTNNGRIAYQAMMLTERGYEYGSIEMD